MAAKPEAPTEPFKRALAHAARSLAEAPDLEIVYSGEGPSLVGRRATLPHPPRDLNGREAARIRGLADRFALRLAHHDEAAYARTRPADAAAVGVFEALEQARLEAIGAVALGGVRDNLRAVLETEIERKGLARMEDRTKAPLADVLALMARERMTGEPPPDGARGVVSMLRAEIEDKAGRDLDRLAQAMADQTGFAKVAKAIISDMGMGEDASTDRSDESGDEEPQADSEPDSGEEGKEPQPSESEAAAPEEDQDTSSDSRSAEEAADAEAGEDSEVADDAPDVDDVPQRVRPDPLDAKAAEPSYKVFSSGSDEVVAADDLCDPEELTRLRAYLDQQLSVFSSVA
jgi:cobaltochelatase CobT